MITKVKNFVPRTYVISDLNRENIVGTFYGKELQKTNQKEKKSSELKKYKRKKATNYILNGKVTIVLLIVGMIKKQYK